MAPAAAARLALWAALAAPAARGGGGPADPTSRVGNRVVMDLHTRAAPRRRKHPSRTSSASRRLFGDSASDAIREVQLETDDNVQYRLQIFVGQPCNSSGGSARGQMLEVLPDTGSSDLWFSSANCSNCHKEATKFEVAQSCSAEQPGKRYSFGYRDGTFVTGGTLVDSVRLGDLQVTHQTMILVDTMGETDTHLKADGILGLGPESVASDTFVAKLFLQYPELPKQFSFFLSRFLEQPSHLLIGEADLASYSKESAFQYSTSWHGSRSRTWLAGMWSIGWTGTDVIAYNASGGMDPTLVMGMPTLVDSGTSLIVVSAGIYDRLVPELAWRMGSCRHNDEEDILECQCPPLNDLSKLPWLALTFVDESGEHFVLSMAPDEYIIEAAGEDYPGQRLCIPSLTRGEYSLQHPVILGMTFMRSFYTVFDASAMRVGFARSSESPLPAGMELWAQLCLKRAIWMATLLVTLMSVMLACYVLFDPDPRGKWSLWCEAKEARTITGSDG